MALTAGAAAMEVTPGMVLMEMAVMVGRVLTVEAMGVMVVMVMARVMGGVVVMPVGEEEMVDKEEKAEQMVATMEAQVWVLLPRINNTKKNVLASSLFRLH
ncbi:hypothetical protein J1786_00185 [Rahnella sp. L72c]|uniref:Uncharacterized protein n=1 Tax=Rahnella perminowiae TaxID=2816244 RepID=A0ABS6KVE3_9GAMM|nr:hypothetical protein [Rahnella perminowiae]MBU9833278.1 hypothetical protein [Rahnella perminowiae]